SREPVRGPLDHRASFTDRMGCSLLQACGGYRLQLQPLPLADLHAAVAEAPQGQNLPLRSGSVFTSCQDPPSLRFGVQVWSLSSWPRSSSGTASPSDPFRTTSSQSTLTSR